MSEHKLTDILGIESLPTPVVPSESDIVMVPAPTDHTVETDATYARENIRNLIKVSGPALSNLMSVATESQHPRAYEVVTQLLKTISDLNKDLMDVHEKEQKLTGNTADLKSGGIHVKNAVFVGTTKELHEQLKKPHG
jgi:hypothetical protein